jgi:hypothetical protein
MLESGADEFPDVIIDVGGIVSYARHSFGMPYVPGDAARDHSAGSRNEKKHVCIASEKDGTS